MIHVDPVEPEENAWKEWREAVQHAEGNLESAKDVDDKLYKGGREAIYRLFHGKCAYCEMSLAGQRFGDVEHFRPKGRVTDENYQLVYIDAKTKKLHPGYYWLAYDWTNLLPACVNCNRYGTNTDATRSGKWDRFPVAGKRAFQRGDPLPPEMPVLINPYTDDPSEHLTFDPDTGTVGGKTPRGEATVRILGLNRDDLLPIRRLIAKAARDDYYEYVDATAKKHAERRAARKAAYEKYENGEEPFSAFGREAIRQLRELIKQATGG